MQIVILVLVGLFLVTSAQAASAPAGGRVVYDGFESGSFASGWTTTFSDGMGTITTTSRDGIAGAKFGTRMLEGRYEMPNFWFCGSIDINALYTNEIFVRIWVRLDTDVQNDQGSMAHLIRFYNGSFGGTGEIVTSLLNGNLFQTDAYFNSTFPANSPVHTPFSPGIGDRQWHKYEQYVNNATHIYKIWQDDVLLATMSDPAINMHWSNFIPLHNWGSPKPTDNNTHIYFDEVEVYSDHGTGGSGSMANGDITQGGSSDTIPPVAPVNLRVQ